MKTFKQNLKTITGSTGTVRNAIQGAVIQALDFYKCNINKAGNEEQGDTGYLTKLMLTCNSTKSLKTKQLQSFIEAHANVKWKTITNKAGEKQSVFKKVDKTVVISEVTELWYEWDKPQAEKKRITKDFPSAAAKMLKDIEGGEFDFKKGTEDQVEALRIALQNLYANK